MVKPNKTPKLTPDQLLETIFMPEDLQNLRLQHERYARIQKAEGKKDEVGLLGYLSMTMKVGMGVLGMQLIEHENRLGL